MFGYCATGRTAKARPASERAPVSEEARPRAALVAVQLPDADDTAFASSVAELGRLARTLGLDVVATVTQKRSSLETAAVVGSGKLGELKRLAGRGASEDEAEDEAEDVNDDEGRRREIDVVLSNSFGFGGTYAALVLRRVE